MDKIKSSTKKVLGGVCLFLVLILVKVVSSEFGKEYANDYTNKFLYPESKLINDRFNKALKKRKFPMVIDENTTLVSILAKGRYINYYYILHDLDSVNFDSEIFKEEIYKNAKKDLHGTDFCHFLIKNQYTAKYNYVFKNESGPEMIIYLTYKDCQ
ncbi:TPA: hypothetical protein R4H00_000661 [Salmonella enterica subsp. enterica serovar Orientalis]|nr:hypothetical protein [Salmonella enterica subsp. enterica serovar Orientalis]